MKVTLIHKETDDLSTGTLASLASVPDLRVLDHFGSIVLAEYAGSVDALRQVLGDWHVQTAATLSFWPRNPPQAG